MHIKQLEYAVTEKLGGTALSWKITLLFGAIAIALAIVVSSILFKQSLARQQHALVEVGLRLTSDFEHEMAVRANSVNAMVLMAQDFMEGRVALTYDPTQNLQPVRGRDGYTLAPPPGYRADQIGNLTGAGAIPAPSTPAAQEMRMALALTPLFHAVTTRDPDTPWVYYTSANHFLYLYPRIGIDDFFFSPAVYDHDFFRGATPAINPNRRLFWTPVYLDQAGKGRMVTVSAPLYVGDNFKGSVSIDISIDKLAWLLERYRIPNSTVHLVAKNGRTLVNAGALPAASRPDKLPLRKPFLLGNAYITAFPLEGLDWYIIIKTPQHILIGTALKQSVIYGAMALLLLGCLILIAALTKTLQRMRILSIQDALTGLYNRRFFDETSKLEFGRIRRESGIIGLIIVDIDYFKKYNDRYGHQSGDKALRAVAKSLVNTLQRSNDRVFRVGGEEFAILISLENAAQLADATAKLAAAIRALAIPHEAAPLQQLTISLGAVAVDAAHWIDVEAAYRLADGALYRAKNGGRNRAEIAVQPTQSTDHPAAH